MHDLLSGKAVTGVCTFYNKTPVDWYCKQQATSETATYGAEFLSVRKCFENIIDHRAYLCYLGKPVGEMDYVWGDNESMINSSTIPESKLNKRHNILSFHYVRSMISRGCINLQHLASEWNFADILTKNWSYQNSYYFTLPHVKILLNLFFDCVSCITHAHWLLSLWHWSRRLFHAPQYAEY